MLTIRTILHPTDFSDCADHAFRLACALAHDYDARLIVLHVAKGPEAGPVRGHGPPGADEYWEDLGYRLSKLQASDPTVHAEHRLGLGNCPTEVLQMARQTKCDLIVMGTQGRTGLKRLLMGSVAEEVMRRAPCPVVIVHAPQGAPPARPAAKPAGDLLSVGNDSWSESHVS